MELAEKVAQMKRKAASRGVKLRGAAFRVPSEGRGAGAEKRRPAPESPETGGSNSEPPTPRTKTEQRIAAALVRPFPCRNWSDNKWTSTAAGNTAAWLIAKALGPDWRHVKEEFRERSYRGERNLIRRADGLTIAVRLNGWQNKDRFQFTLLDGRNSITTAGNRTPVSIAGDIERRLLTADAVKQWQKSRNEAKSRRLDWVRNRRIVLRMMRALKQSTVADQRTAHNHFRTDHMVPMIKKRFETRITAGVGLLDRAEIQIETADEHFAEFICEQIQTYWSSGRNGRDNGTDSAGEAEHIPPGRPRRGLEEGS